MRLHPRQKRAIPKRLAAKSRKQKENVMRAMWNGQVIAESDATVVVEGNHYFPRDAIKSAHF